MTKICQTYKQSSGARISVSQGGVKKKKHTKDELLMIKILDEEMSLKGHY